MAEPHADDPFLWGVNVVAEKLSSVPCQWARNPVEFAATIRSEEFDGRTLLTMERIFSRQEFLHCLGIKVARQKVALMEEVKRLRKASPAYQKWRREQLLMLTDDLDDFHEDNKKHRQTTHHGEPGSSEQPNGITQPPIAPPSVKAGLLDSESAQKLPKPSREPSPAAISLPPTADEQPPALAQDIRPPKRRRLAPVHLGTKAVQASGAFIPTEADNILFVDEAFVSGVGADLPWEKALPSAYLGEGGMSKDAIPASSGQLTSRILDFGHNDFATIVPNMLPRGRRQVVYRATMRLLRANSRKEALFRQGIVPMRSPSPTDSDSVVDLSDLPELDAETLQEIEEERIAQERAMAEQAERALSQDAVQKILTDAIQSMTTKWQERKLPKLQRKAYKIWTDARRHGIRLSAIIDAQKKAKHFDDSIKNLCAEILDMKWSKEAGPRAQAESLEQTLENKLHQLWLVDMLESRIEPQKPDRAIPQRRATQRPVLSFDEEILTSSEDDDFIVPDDDDGFIHEDGFSILVDAETQLRDGDQTGMVKPESPRSVDMIQEGSTTKGRPNGNNMVYIDLTTPTKPKDEIPASAPDYAHADHDLMVPPPELESESVDEIKRQGPLRWQDENDRWRLVICLMSRLTHERRTAILDLVESKSDEDAWLLSILSQLEDPVTEPSKLGLPKMRLTAFDSTRIFLSFVKVTVCKERRISKISPANRERLQKAEARLFPSFCNFLRTMAPRFPQQSQIFRVDLSDEDLEAADDEDVLDGRNDASQGRKAVSKEIVRDKEAVDLRARERLRVEEQETRRLKLRAALATNNVMPGGKSRLIINESKSDDQAFIYINDEIAKSIKNHQIDGVRFLWNQIVQDVEARQGCLLAHTMGLGKTMQVITLLVAIQEASASKDQSIKSQIPQDLQRSKTLVLCPAGLVDNWMDELLTWAPGGLLGDLRKVDSLLSQEERSEAIHGWANQGGVLIIGYNMFKKVFKQDDKIEDVLTQGANIVVADEAHMLKSPKSEVNRVCSEFRTGSRIALTGSPLANNVEEYHAMINWVAPNFLGPLGEFREIYANPIHTGLWTESLKSERRRALKMLQVLKETVAPKVHRATIKSIKDDLPPKFEFVISVPPTDMQRKLYDLYVDGMEKEFPATNGKIPQAQVFSLVNDLGLICAHPRCFRQKVMDVKMKLGTADERTFPQAIIPPVLKETNAHDPDSISLSMKVVLLTKILDEARACNDKVLVFSQSIMALNYLDNLFKMQRRNFSRLDGKTPIGRRQDMVKGFNRGAHEVYLISTTAGGVGLNIQGANRVIIFDSKWNPVNDQQAIGRAYRIGQKKTVYVYRLLMAGSFEDDLQNKSVFKMQLSSRVVDKKNPVVWSKRLSSLMHQLKEVKASDLSSFVGRDNKILDKLISFRKGQAILNILSDDTFEEEDPTVALTAEERQDAEGMVARNRLRLTNPEEYGRLMRKEIQDQRDRLDQIRLHAQSQAAPPSLSTPFPPTGRSYVGPQSQSAHGTIPNLSGGTPRATPPSMPRPTPPAERPYVGAQSQSAPGTIPYQIPSVVTPQAATTSAAAYEGFGMLKLSQPAPAPSPVPTWLPRPAATPMPAEHEGFGIMKLTRPPPAPSPMAGANTFFGQQHHPMNGQDRAATMPPLRPQAEGQGNLFAQPVTPQARTIFENQLASRLRGLENTLYTGLTHNADVIARNVTATIAEIRKEKKLGLLPDQQQWRSLCDLLEHDRFVLHVAAGYLTPITLALTDKKELERRIDIINALPVVQFHEQLNRGTILRDPNNLENLHLPRSDAPSTMSPRALADLKAMREAADNRFVRSTKSLPPWANEALVGGRGRDPFQ